MTQLPLPNNPPPSPSTSSESSTSSTPSKPAQFVQLVGDCVFSMVKLTAWLIVAAASLAVGYLSLRAIWWAVNLATRAIGLEV